MLMTNLRYVGAFLNPYLLDEARLHDDANAKTFNKVLWKKTHTPIAYALTLKDFVENQSPFFDTL
jgi:hypothetical protein